MSSLIPGGGWMVDYHDESRSYTVPVVAWRLDEDGQVVPLGWVDGKVVDLTSDDAHQYRIYYPSLEDQQHAVEEFFGQQYAAEKFFGSGQDSYDEPD